MSRSKDKLSPEVLEVADKIQTHLHTRLMATTARLAPKGMDQSSFVTFSTLVREAFLDGFRACSDVYDHPKEFKP